MLVSVRPLQSSLMLVGKARNYKSEAPFSNPTLGQAVALPAKIRLGYTGLPGTNALAYYKNLLTMVVKVFIRLGPGLNVIKHFTTVIYKFS